MAVASMVLGILSVYTRLQNNIGFAILLALVSILLGILVSVSKKKVDGQKGMVITAFILSGIVLALNLLGFIPNILNEMFRIWGSIFNSFYWYY